MAGDIDPLDHDIWLPFDETMMRVADTLFVATMLSWAQSKGIAHEIAWFSKHRKPIYFLDVETLELHAEATA